mmetsp:Transcript_44716/g.103285  ORF Transcript_44716/g.103285 Transcript_44716/m.103285 type:complete len:215 (+) Transcript_44716:604-1248(+)
MRVWRIGELDRRLPVRTCPLAQRCAQRSPLCCGQCRLPCRRGLLGRCECARDKGGVANGASCSARVRRAGQLGAAFLPGGGQHRAALGSRAGGRRGLCARAARAAYWRQRYDRPVAREGGRILARKRRGGDVRGLRLMLRAERESRRGARTQRYRRARGQRDQGGLPHAHWRVGRPWDYGRGGAASGLPRPVSAAVLRLCLGGPWGAGGDARRM